MIDDLCWLCEKMQSPNKQFMIRYKAANALKIIRRPCTNCRTWVDYIDDACEKKVKYLEEISESNT